jgi:predicted phosphatase
MKIIIKESRVEKILKSYIVKQLGDYTEVPPKPYDDSGYYKLTGVFKMEQGKKYPAIVLYDDDFDVYIMAIDTSLFNATATLFSIEPSRIFDKLENVIKEVIKHNYGLEISTIVTY